MVDRTEGLTTVYELYPLSGMKRANPASVAAVVLNWNNYSDTSTCLDSLSRIEYPKIQHIVVDNGSTDQSKEKIANQFPTVRIISSESNRGFAGGMNLGIQKLIHNGFDYIWLLNNDTEFPRKEVLQSLVEVLETNSNVGMVTPVIWEGRNSRKRWFTRGKINWKTATANHTNPPISSLSELVENQYIPLCSALVDADVFKDIGFLPEQYFLYYEDLDFGVTLRDHGYDIVTCTSTSVVHKQGGTAGRQFDSLYSYYQPRNLLLFARKFRDRLKTSFPPSIARWATEQIAFRIIKGYTATPFIQGLYDGIRGRTGKGRYPSK